MPKSLGDKLQAGLVEQAIELATKGRFVEAATKFEQSGKNAAELKTGSTALAYAFYRLALHYMAEYELQRAIQRLEIAKRFPNLPRHLTSLFQERIAIIQRDPIDEVRKFDAAIAERFESGPKKVTLRDEFLQRYTLDQPKRKSDVAAIEGVSSIGVYRWAGDINRNHRWSQLIREFKQGDERMPALFGRILAEHVRTNDLCMEWFQEVDYIVPVPASPRRMAERGSNIVVKMGEHLSSRLKIPLRTDFLRRSENSDRSRDVGKAALASQYSFNRNSGTAVEDRVVLLLDDVMTRGHTAEICASRLREHGCKKVFLLVLALAESTLQSGRHSQT